MIRRLLTLGGRTSALALALTLVQVPSAGAFPAGYQYVLTPDLANPGKFMAMDDVGQNQLVLSPAKRGVLSQQWSARLPSGTAGVIKLQNRQTGRCIQYWTKHALLGPCTHPSSLWRQHQAGIRYEFSDPESGICLTAHTANREVAAVHECDSPAISGLKWWSTAKA
jgi:hypothetical protein